MPPTVLVIEDNPVIRQLLRLGFEERGWTVAEAGDAFRGLALFQELVPQLVTLDLIMPINDGLDSVQVAKTIAEQYPNATLFVLSALSAEPKVNRFFSDRKIELFDKLNPGNCGFVDLFNKADALFQQLTNQNPADGSRRTPEGRAKWTN